MTTSQAQHKNHMTTTYNPNILINWFPNLGDSMESCLDLEEKLESLFSLQSSFQNCDEAQTKNMHKHKLLLCLLTCLEIN